MKKQALRVLIMLSLFVTLAVASVHAQFDGQIAANIPFEFIVGKTTLPAGEYTVEPLRTAPGLLIRSVDSRACVMVLTNSVQASAIQAKAKLVFNRYGDQYFLSQVWTPGDYIGRELIRSRHELELAKSTPKPQTATLMGQKR